MIKYKRNLILYVMLAVSLGAAAGAVVWFLLWVMDLGIELVWEIIPGYTGHAALYNLAVCLTGGLIIGVWQKKFGIYPKELEEVMHELRSTGTYPYNRIHILAVSALLPLVFGGCLGPEAGLTGIIVGLCCMVLDSLKYKGREIRELAEAGIAATLGVVFNSPFIGIAFNYESPDESGAEDKAGSEKELFKKIKMLVYVASVAGGFSAMLALNGLTGGGGGIPRFDRHVDIPSGDWKWFAVLFAAGIVAGIIYAIVHKITLFIGEKLIKYRITSCIIAGALLAVIGTAFPQTMFSGEHQMGELMGYWSSKTAVWLISTALAKLILVNICIDLGWKGGSIFPIIFSGVSLGYAMAILTGVEPIFAVAVCTAALCGYIMRKPMMVIGVLLLCFPITVIIPMAGAAYCGSLIPTVGYKRGLD